MATMNRPFRQGKLTSQQAELLNQMHTNWVRVKVAPPLMDALDLQGNTQRISLDIKALRDLLSGSGSGTGASGSGGGSGSGGSGSGGSGSGESGGSGSGSGVTNWTSQNAYAYPMTVVESVCPTYALDNSIWAGDAFGGDVSGNAPTLSVVKLRGYGISSSVPSTGQALIFDGTNWTPTTLSSTGVATGTVVAFINTVPTGYLELVGGNISRSTYSTLFSYVGTLYGNGNGSTTFGLPDARGRTIIGAGTGSGLTLRTLAATLGAESVALISGNNGPHTHAPLSANRFSVANAAGGTLAFAMNAVGGFINATGLDTTTASSGSGTAHENMQPSIVFRWAVKT